jgi:hypothetical protein
MEDMLLRVAQNIRQKLEKQNSNIGGLFIGHKSQRKPELSCASTMSNQSETN